MKAFKICYQGMWIPQNNIRYASNYNKAIQIFNDMIRKKFKEMKSDLIEKDIFSDQVYEFRKSSDIDIICRTYPLLTYKYENKIIANLLFWEEASYEYEEYDIESAMIVLEEIEIEE